MDIKHLLAAVRDDIRTAAGVAAATIFTGVTLVIDLIPDDIGKASTVVGMMLSGVLIYTHARNGYMERKKMALEIREMERKEAERREERRGAGLPDLYVNAREGDLASAGPFGRRKDQSPDST